jgi:histidine ammonia-lyase
MSAGSAFAARETVAGALTVVAIELLVACEGAEYVDDDLTHGTGTAAAYDAVREVVDPLSGDRPLHPDIDRADALVTGGLLEDRVEAALDDDLE